MIDLVGQVPRRMRHHVFGGLCACILLGVLSPLAWAESDSAAAPRSPARAEGRPALTQALTSLEPRPGPPHSPPPSPPPGVASLTDGGPTSTTREWDGDHGDPLAVRPFEDNWWTAVRPMFEVHGYFRTRGESFYNFTLGRSSAAGGTSLWPNPLDNSTTVAGSGQPTAMVCGSNGESPCNDKTESSGNMRFRMEPELHLSDNLRILGQVDAFNNLVLGSTPNSYAVQPASSSSSSPNTNSSGYQSAGGNPYAPSAFFSTTQGSPTAGVNSLQNSIDVQRLWVEYDTPFGQLRFGRLPEHWGLGMVWNSGSTIDSDYQTNTDRIQFISRLGRQDLYLGGSWDFVSTGPTSANAYSIYGGQPYNTANLTNVAQWNLFVARKRDPQLQRLDLARGNIVVNAGLYTTFREQYLDIATGQTPLTLDTSSSSALQAAHDWMLTPDVWVQVLWRKLRFEAEAATHWGQLGSSPIRPVTNGVFNPVKIREFGLVTQTEFRAFEDKLKLQFGFGWTSGDQWQPSLKPSGTLAGSELNGNGPISTFAFHPDYRIDLIFFRNILGAVEGAYYFRPSVDYDLIRQPNGHKLGAGTAVIWSRASDYVQAPGHAHDLGVEVDSQVYYQSKDGTVNDDPGKLGGFYASLQYGVFVPLAGLRYLPGIANGSSLSVAQTARLILGVAF